MASPQPCSKVLDPLVDVESDAGAALGFVSRVGELALGLGHDVDLDVRGSLVGVALSSADVGGITHRDTALAGQVASLAQRLGGTTEPGMPAAFELGIDTGDADAIRPSATMSGSLAGVRKALGHCQGG